MLTAVVDIFILHSSKRVKGQSFTLLILTEIPHMGDYTCIQHYLFWLDMLNF